MGHRREKIAEKIRHEASRVIQQEINDPRMRMVSIVRVDPSPDLRNAKLYFSVIGSDTDLRTVERGLEHARGFIQSVIGKRLGMKYTPKIQFVADESIKKSVEISKLIDEALNG